MRKNSLSIIIYLSLCVFLNSCVQEETNQESLATQSSQEGSLENDVILKILNSKEKAAVLSEIENGYDLINDQAFEEKRKNFIQDEFGSSEYSFSLKEKAGKISRECELGNQEILKKLSIVGTDNSYFKIKKSIQRQLHIDIALLSNEDLRQIESDLNSTIISFLEDSVNALSSHTELLEELRKLETKLDEMQGVDLQVLKVLVQGVISSIESTQSFVQSEFDSLLSSLNSLYSQVIGKDQSDLRSLIISLTSLTEERGQRITSLNEILSKLQGEKIDELSGVKYIEVQRGLDKFIFILELGDLIDISEELNIIQSIDLFRVALSRCS